MSNDITLEESAQLIRELRNENARMREALWMIAAASPDNISAAYIARRALRREWTNDE